MHEKGEVTQRKKEYCELLCNHQVRIQLWAKEEVVRIMEHKLFLP